MPDPLPELDLERAHKATQSGSAAISRAAQEMRAAGVPRDRMISALAIHVVGAVFEVHPLAISCDREMIVDEDVTRQLADEIAAMLASPLHGLLPMGRA